MFTVMQASLFIDKFPRCSAAKSISETSCCSGDLRSGLKYSEILQSVPQQQFAFLSK